MGKLEKKFEGKVEGTSVLVDRRHISRFDYSNPNDGYDPTTSVTWLDVTNPGGVAAAITLGLDETKGLIAALEAIVENVEGLLPKEDFRDKLVDAPAGSTLTNKRNDRVFIKLETDEWVSLKSGNKFTSRDSFSNAPDNYVLTLPEAEKVPATWLEKLEAAPAGSSLRGKTVRIAFFKSEDGTWSADASRITYNSRDFPEARYTLALAEKPKLSFHEQLQSAEAGSTVKVNRFGNVYTKGGDELWRTPGYGGGFSYSAFSNNADRYTLTPPPTWEEQKVNAPAGSEILNRINGRRFVKLGTGDWVSLTSGTLFDSVDGFTGKPNTYVLTLADAK